jgi:hypothetical protein
VAEAPTTLLHVAALSKMLLEALEGSDAAMASDALLADLHELSERAHADLQERFPVRGP